jgi:DNA-binding transcriptional LysR family regulator
VRLQAPIIEGQSPGYLVNQLRRFRERHRDSFPMSALVAAGMGLGVVPQLAMAAKPENVEIRPLLLPESLSRVGAAWTDLDTPIKRVFSRFLGRTEADLVADEKAG